MCVAEMPYSGGGCHGDGLCNKSFCKVLIISHSKGFNKMPGLFVIAFKCDILTVLSFSQYYGYFYFPKWILHSKQLYELQKGLRHMIEPLSG